MLGIVPNDSSYGFRGRRSFLFGSRSTITLPASLLHSELTATSLSAGSRRKAGRGFMSYRKPSLATEALSHPRSRATRRRGDHRRCVW